MSLNESFIAELQEEAVTTRKCLERIPESKFDWKPHEKSFTMSKLAAHVAETVGWITEVIKTPELDFAEYEHMPFQPQTTGELVECFDKNLAAATEALKNASDETLMENWKLREGEKVYFDLPRAQALRGMVFNHIISHRGQLSVYLRLNDISVPELYGPSADEGSM